MYVGNAKGEVVMYEGSAKEISEADFNAALKFAQEAIQPMIQAQKDLAAKVGKKKREITLNIVPEEILKEAKSRAGGPASFKDRACIHIVTIVALGCSKDRFDLPPRLHQRRPDGVVIILMQRISGPNRPAYTAPRWILSRRIIRIADAQ